MAEKKKLTAESLPFNSTQAAAVQAFAAGIANDGQQKTVLRWLLDNVCEMGVLPYRDTDRETVLACGRQFVGARLLAAMNANISRLKTVEEKRT